MNGLMQVGRTDLIESLLGDKLLGKLFGHQPETKFWFKMRIFFIGLAMLLILSITYATLPTWGYQWKGPLAGDVYSIVEFSQTLLNLNTMSNDESSSYIQPMESRSHSSNDI